MARSPELVDLARGFGLLSDPTRLDILKVLTAGPRNVSALYKAVNRNQQTVSHHLGLLRLGRLVVGTRKGKTVEYKVDTAALKELRVGLAKITPRK
jgi:ArsR family transcriptional regulator